MTRKAPPPPTFETTLLHEAAATVSGPRSTTHGDIEDNFINIAQFWNLYLTTKYGPEAAQITPTDVAEMQALVKLSRRLVGKPIYDHYMDSAGYIAIAAGLALEI